MTIGIIFQFGMDNVEIKINNFNVYFRTSQFMQFVTIDGLRLDKKGVIKEFPDLENKVDWREEAIKRFKEKIKQMNTEKEIAEYVLEDLTKFGYKPIYWQQKGHRPIKFK